MSYHGSSSARRALSLTFPAIIEFLFAGLYMNGDGDTLVPQRVWRFFWTFLDLALWGLSTLVRKYAEWFGMHVETRLYLHLSHLISSTAFSNNIAAFQDHL
jgi:hypothetical protein